MSRLLPLLLFLGLGVLLAVGLYLAEDKEKLPSTLIDQPAPAFNLPTLDDPQQRISSEEFAGRPYLINVWGSWCYGCRVEHPVLTDLAARSGIPLIGLNWKDRRDDARRWLDQFGDPFSVVLVDEAGDTAIDLGVSKAPETFVVDATGRIRHKHLGPLDQNAVENTFLPLIRSLDSSGEASE